MLKLYKISRWIAIAFAVILVGLYFIPISSIDTQYREDFSLLEALLGVITDSEANVTISDYMDVSFYSLLKISRLEGREGMEYWNGSHAIMIGFLVLCIVVLLFALTGLSIPLIVFDGLTLWLYYVLTNRVLNGLVYGSVYRTSVAYILYYIVFIAIICISIERVVLWFVTRGQRKKMKRQTE